MKSKKVTVYGNELEYVYSENSKIYWLDECGNNTQGDYTSYEHVFEAEIYRNGKFTAYVTDDVYNFYSPRNAVRILMSCGLNIPEAIEVYNAIGRAMGNPGYYSEANFRADQLEKQRQYDALYHY